MKKRPNPATAHTQSRQRGAQTTSRSSALVRGRSTQFIANPCRWPQRPCPNRGYISAIFPPFLQVYKNAWHVPCSATNSLYTFPTAECGHECPLPPGVLTQALLQHVDQCMWPADVVIEIMLAQLARTLTEWHCNSFTDLIDEMELWDWNVANKDFWSRLAKSLQCQKVSVSWAQKMDKKFASVLVPEQMSWATATQSIRKCKTRIEKIGGSRVHT